MSLHSGEGKKQNEGRRLRHEAILQAENDVNMMRREKTNDHTSAPAIMFASSFFAMMHSA